MTLPSSPQAPTGAFALALVLFSGTSAAAQTTWYVDGSAQGPGSGTSTDPFQSIQHAVDQGTTLAGDTLELAAGLYVEAVDLQGKALTIRGSGAAVLNAPGEADIVIAGLGAAAARLEGLEFRGGFGDGDLVDGVLVQDSVLEVVNCTFSGGSTWGPLAGGIYAEDSQLVISSSSFSDCMGGEAGAMWVIGGSLDLWNCIIQRCDAGRFQGSNFKVAGIRCSDATVRFETSTFRYNDSADANIGGAGLVNCQSTILGCDFIRNDCSSYGRTGSLHVDMGALLLEDSTLEFGQSYGYAGNLHLEDVDATIRRTTFDHGFVRGTGSNAAGGNTFQRGGNATFEDCMFLNGDSSTCGGAGFEAGSTATLLRCQFSQNRSFYGPAPLRGSALLATNGTNVTVRESIFQGNLISCDSAFNPAATITGAIAIESCTLVDNLNGALGNEVYGGSVSHSILWGFAPPSAGCPIGAVLGGTATATWSDIEGGAPGVGNFSAAPGLDPMHAPLAGSPCIDAGDPALGADADGSPRDVGALAWSWPSVSIPECSTTPNSTGAVGQTEAFGAPAAAGGTLYLRASDLPTQSTAMFLISTAPGSVQLGNGGIGTLCLASPIGRFQMQATTTGSSGVASISVNSSALPIPGGTATAGAQYWFQGWFRDVGPSGAATSRVTTGVSVQFQ